MARNKVALKSALAIALAGGALLLGGSFAAPRGFDDQQAIRSFVAEMNQRHGFDASELERLFARARLHQDILDAIARPAEAKPWFEYRPIFVNGKRIKGGVTFWNENAQNLGAAAERFGVPAEVMVAIIGVETRYGRHQGRYPVLDSLSTLAFAYPPRSKFFRGELEQYLLMAREEKMDPLAQLGSYAGAMGMPQFISSSFRRYAVDFDGDGRRDLWNSTADAIGSVGNYFSEHRWQPGQPIALQVKVSGERWRQLLKDNKKPRWSPQQLAAHGVALPGDLSANLKGMLIELETDGEPEYWVGWDNFYVITRYNHSNLYAMAVYQLSEAIRQAR
ncbi:MAG: lytic murein transglycosylase B [Pseudomonadota bacterium]|nr:MAG: lytic murein transglycosylase B [Pseudomonadota bacterium]